MCDNRFVHLQRSGVPMYLKNYIVTPVDGRQVSMAESYPTITVNFRHIVDNELIQIEHRQVPLDILIYECPNALGLEQNILWEEVRDRLDELFVHFLESVAGTWSLNTWFDLVRLLDSRMTTYHLVASSEIVSQLMETGETEEGINGSGFPLYHHWFEIVRQPYLNDNACYVIPPEYYVTYLHKYEFATSYRVNVCSFLDLSEQAFQPIRLQPQSVIDLLIAGQSPHYMGAERRNGVQAPLVQLDKGSLRHWPAESTHRELTGCPVCNGSIHHLNEKDAFCLDCDWDNLRPIC